MTSPPIESYVKRLRQELRRHFIADPRIIDEVRDHLIDAVEGARERDHSLAADALAIERFGSPTLVAAAFVADETRILHRCLLVAASLAGIAIALVDATPTWDDAGITAGAMVIMAAALGVGRSPTALALGAGRSACGFPPMPCCARPRPAPSRCCSCSSFRWQERTLGRAARRVLMGRP